MWKKVVLFAVIAVLCALPVCACSSEPPSAEDFALTVTVENQEIAQGEDFCFFIQFENKSGRSLRVEHSGNKDIESMLQWFLWNDDGYEYVAYPANAVSGVLKKNAVLDADWDVDTSDIPKGEYKFAVRITFTCMEQDFRFESDEYAITIC